MSGRAERKPAVVMFVMNDLLNDPRVQREARAAVQAGFRVTVVARQSERCRTERETVDGYEIVRVRAPQFRVTLPLFTLLCRLLSFRWVVAKAGVVLQEGVKLALGLPPGPEAPQRAAGHVSRLRRFKWGLMRGIGILLFPVRVFRPVLRRHTPQPHADTPSKRSWSGFWGKVRRGVYEADFVEDMFWTTYAMLRSVRPERADVFHGNDLPTLPLTSWAARRVNGKAVYDSHELWAEQGTDMTPFLVAISRRVEARYIRRMDAVVTVNDFLAEALRKQYRVPPPTVIMNCPELSTPRPVPLGSSIRAALGLSPRTPLILYQGRYGRGRGLEALIESGRYLTQGVIVLRGYGDNEADLRRRAADPDVSGRVFMVDPVPMADLVAAAAEADVGVVPYTACARGYYYASPNKLFEYMMAGLAIAVSALPFLEKIVRDDDLGVVFDPSDPRHIAEQLNVLTGNAARLRSCRANALRAARERYHWGYEGRKLVMLYQNLAAVTTCPSVWPAAVSGKSLG